MILRSVAEAKSWEKAGDGRDRTRKKPITIRSEGFIPTSFLFARFLSLNGITD
jgi:hypothetical protein